MRQDHPFSPGSTALSRRKFLALSSLAAGSVVLPGCATRRRKPGSTDKLSIICVGAGGKGTSDIANCAGENILAICDVDERRAAPVLADHPKAKFYKDWRVMLERETKADAVVISTPDHTHAPIAAAAMRERRAVFCQKPLTHSVYEARTLRDMAQKNNVVTQMGNQGSAEDGLRRACEVVQSGLLGQVRRVHLWTNRPIWPQGMERPRGSDPIPPGLDWNLWLGPAPARPFKEGIYHPFKWRGWLDFGTGALGDMGCHTANMPFRALNLGAPTTVEAEATGMTSEAYPTASWVRFVFPERGNMAEVDLWWYDGGLLPDEFLLTHVKKLMDEVPKSGCLLVGDKGLLFSPDDYGARFFIKLWDEDELIPGTQHEAVADIPRTIPRNRFKGNAGERHAQEWIAACKGDGTCYSSFDQAAALTEVILLGCVALRETKRLIWNPEKLRMTNAPELDSIIRPAYREGWEL
jgi:predicted dehydrogenase